MKKLFSIMLAVVMLALCLTACGDSGNGKDSSTTETNDFKIIGTWKLISPSENISVKNYEEYTADRNKKTFWEFTNNNKILYNFENENEDSLSYEINGDELRLFYDSDKDIPEEYQYSIKYRLTKLNDTEMELQDISSPTTILSFKKLENETEKAKESAIKSETDNFKDANSLAYITYCTLVNTSSDEIDKGNAPKKIRITKKAVEELKNSSDPLEKAVWDYLKDNKGYVSINYDPYDTTNTKNWVQWQSNNKATGEVTGQYPNEPKSVEEAKNITFGKYDEPYS